MAHVIRSTARRSVILLVALLTACSGTGVNQQTTSSRQPPTTEPVGDTTPPREPVVTVGPVITLARSEFSAWYHSPSAVEGVDLSDGQQYTFNCRPGGEAYAVWGTDIYTHDSSVCTAAVHAGLIDFEDGGAVVIELRSGEPSYVGSTANGVTTESYGRWGRSFVFVDASVAIAESFMTALNAHDVDAMLALAAPELINAENSPDGTLEGFRAEIEQEGVLGWTYDFTCDVVSTDSTPTIVGCPYSFSNHLTEAFGLEPYPGSTVSLAIVDGEVTSFTNKENTNAWQGEGLGMFYQWMIENYPADAEGFYYNYTDEANLNFWKKYMPLFLESEVGSD